MIIDVQKGADEDGDLEDDGRENGDDVFLNGGNMMLVSHDDGDDVNEDENGYDARAAWEGKRH